MSDILTSDGGWIWAIVVIAVLVFVISTIILTLRGTKKTKEMPIIVIGLNNMEFENLLFQTADKIFYSNRIELANYFGVKLPITTTDSSDKPLPLINGGYLNLICCAKNHHTPSLVRLANYMNFETAFDILYENVPKDSPLSEFDIDNAEKWISKIIFDECNEAQISMIADAITIMNIPSHRKDLREQIKTYI